METASTVKPKRPKRISPTQRSLKKLREEGWTVGITEHWNPYANIRQDLFGFIDLLAFRGEKIMAVQTTSGENVTHRIDKMATIPAALKWVFGGHMLVIHGWRKMGKRGEVKRWACREEYLDAGWAAKHLQPEFLVPEERIGKRL